MNVNVDIKNIGDIRRAFTKAPVLMARELNKAIATAVVMVERDSKINTPVDTGVLRASTYTTLKSLYGEIGTNTSYDIFVHEGTRHFKGRPYLRMAIRSNQVSIDRLFTTAVNNVLHEVGRET